MPREGQIDLPGGGSVACRTWGDPAGAPVVFLHGTPGSRLFLPDPTLAATAGARIVTFDRPGYGGSTSVEIPSLVGVAGIVDRIADFFDLGTVSVVGFSGGGPSAFACAAVLPDRVSRVAVVSSWGPLDELEAAQASLTTDEREVLSAIRADPAGATKLLWESGQWLVETPLRFLETTPEPGDERVLNDPLVRSQLADSNLEAARQGQAGLVADWIADALPWDFQLAEIDVPVDLWVGERDPGRAPLDAGEIARRIPSCTVHRDADAGHWLVISHWQEILEWVIAGGPKEPPAITANR